MIYYGTENRELFEVLSRAKDEKAMNLMICSNGNRYDELPYDAARTICDMAGIDIALVKQVKEDGSEVVCMCKVWDDHKKSGIKEVILENWLDSIRSLMGVSWEIYGRNR